MSVALWLSLVGVLLLAVLLTAYLVPAIRRFRYRAYAAVERVIFWVSDKLFWLFDGIDRAAEWVSKLYLTGHTNGMLRWAAFIGWYSGLFAVAEVADPWVGVAALLWGILSVLLIHRAWVRNEKRRSKIAKKIDPDEETAAGEAAGAGGDPVRLVAELDRLPDLRREAVFSGLLLLVLMPLLLLTWHRAEPVFDADPPGLGGALWLIADRTYLKGPLDLVGLETLHTNVGLRPDAAAGRLIKVFEKLAYYLIFLGLLRWFHIREDVREGVMGARRDPELAVLLGHRAVRRLEYQIAELRPADDAPPAVLKERTEPLVNSLLALGRLHDRRARHTLLRWAGDQEHAPRFHAAFSAGVDAYSAAVAFVRAVREAAVTALGHLAAVPPPEPPRRPKLDRMKSLGGLLQKECEELVREADDVVKALRARLEDELDDKVREAAAVALGMADHPAAVAALLDRLRTLQQTVASPEERTAETYPEVVKQLVQAVGVRLGLGWAGTHPAEPGQRREAVTLLLGADKDSGGHAIPQTPLSLLKHRYLRVRNRAGGALAALGDPAALPALLAELPHNDNPKLLVAWLNAVAVLVKVHPPTDPAPAVAALVAVIRRLNNSSVRQAAAQALAALAKAHAAAARGSAARTLAWALEEAYIQDDRDVQKPLTDILSDETTFRAADRAERAKQEFSFDVLADLMEVVTNASKSVDERKAAAKRLRPLKDAASLNKLKRLLDLKAGDTDPLPDGLRAILRGKVLEMEEVVEERRTPRGEVVIPPAPPPELDG